MRHKGFQGAHLLKQPPFLDNVRNSLHLYTLGFINILESVKFTRLLVLDHADLLKRMV